MSDHINMCDPIRVKRILGKIETLWTVMPDQRLGQLILNFTGCMAATGRSELWYMEDDKIEEELDKWISINCLDGDRGWKA